MIVAAAGDFVTADLVAELENRFASWRGRFDEPRLDLPTAAPPGQSSDRGLFHYQMEIPQAKILLGHRLDEFVPWLDERRFALEVLAEVLGGSGAVSRIAGRLRTYEGLVYRASADLDPGSLWPGELQVFFETANTNVARALSHAMEEIDRMHHELVHPKELEVAQKTIIAEIRLAFDQSEQAAGLLAENELLARPDSYWQDHLKGVLAVTPADVREAAREFLNTDRLICVIVGNWAEITASEQQRDTLRDVFDSAPQHLPPRDPLTLVPLSVPDAGTQSEQSPR